MFGKLLIRSLLLAALFGGAGALQAQEKGRVDNPLQIQLNAAGGGAALGFHLSESFYLGVMQGNPISATIEPGCSNCDEQRYYGQEGLDTQELDWAQRQAVELRYSPWPFGLYFSLGYLKTAGDQATLTYDQRLRIIGDNAYNTGFTAEVEGQPYGGGAFGVGLNHVFEMGLSLGAGFLAGWAQPQDPEVSVSGFDVEVSEADQAALAADLQDNDPHSSQIMFHLSIGYNF